MSANSANQRSWSVGHPTNNVPQFNVHDVVLSASNKDFSTQTEPAEPQSSETGRFSEITEASSDDEFLTQISCGHDNDATAPPANYEEMIVYRNLPPSVYARLRNPSVTQSSAQNLRNRAENEPSYCNVNTAI